MLQMRRIPLVVASVVLASCGSGGGDLVDVCVSQFWNGTLGVCLPDGWQVLSSETLSQNGVPEETVAAFQAREARDGQFDTITVTKEPLPEEMTSQEYSDANVVAVSTLPDYKLLDKRAATIDDAGTEIHIFSARPVAEKPVRRYYQLSAVQERDGYTVTGSLPLSVSDQTEAVITAILQSLTFQDPEAEEAAEE